MNKDLLRKQLQVAIKEIRTFEDFAVFQKYAQILWEGIGDDNRLQPSNNGSV